MLVSGRATSTLVASCNQRGGVHSEDMGGRAEQTLCPDGCTGVLRKCARVCSCRLCNCETTAERSEGAPRRLCASGGFD
eukprot:5312584-Pyramimonas_sp.AAC.1